MPNWCGCELTINGPQADLDRFGEAARGKDGALSFQSLLPMPAEVRDSKENGPSGWPLWYEWAKANWGTKCDLGGETHVEDTPGQIFYAFASANTPPCALVKKVAEDYPALSFELVYAEGGCDFSGTLSASGGKVIETRGCYADSELALLED